VGVRAFFCDRSSGRPERRGPRSDALLLAVGGRAPCPAPSCPWPVVLGLVCREWRGGRIRSRGAFRFPGLSAVGELCGNRRSSPWAVEAVTRGTMGGSARLAIRLVVWFWGVGLNGRAHPLVPLGQCLGLQLVQPVPALLFLAESG